MDRRLGQIAVCALVVLAGCSALGGSRTPAPVTPAPVPTTAPPVAPGVTAGAVDARRVAGRHNRTLANNSFQMHVRYRARAPDGGLLYEMNATGAMSRDGSLRFDRRESTPSGIRAVGRIQTYASDDRSFHRYTYDSGSANVFTVGQPPPGALTRSDAVEEVLSALVVDTAAERPGGGVAVAGRVTDGSAVPITGGVNTPRNASLEATVREDGIVRELTLRYDADYHGEPVVVRYRLAFGEVNVTTVERPAWLERAEGDGP